MAFSGLGSQLIIFLVPSTGAGWTGEIVKIGDLVRVPEAKCNALIVELDDSHRQTTVTVVTEHGYVLERLWSARVKVINEVRD